MAPEVVAQRETERINQELEGIHIQNQEKARKHTIELHQAAQGATLLKEENKKIQATLGALTKERDKLKQKLQEAGTLLDQVAKGDVQAFELKKALEQTPHKGNQREEDIWRVMKESGLKVKEPEQQVKQKPKGHRI